MWAALGADVVVAEPADGHLLRHLPAVRPRRRRPSVVVVGVLRAGQALRRRAARQRGARRAAGDRRRGDHRRRPRRRSPRAGPRPPGRRRRQPVRPDRPAPRLEGLGARRMGVGRHRLHDRLPRPGAGVPGDPGAVRLPRHVAVRGERGDARAARRCAGPAGARSSTCRCRSAASRSRRRPAWRCSSTTGCGAHVPATGAP